MAKYALNEIFMKSILFILVTTLKVMVIETCYIHQISKHIWKYLIFWSLYVSQFLVLIIKT